MISDTTIKKAVFNAVDIMEGLGYTGKHGSIHLMRLGLQTNAITSIFHNLVAWQISKLDHTWKFHSKGGNTADLSDSITGDTIQIKTTSDNKIKGNRITKHNGYYICVKYRVEDYEIFIREILAGDLLDTDWTKSATTQFAFLTKQGESKLKRIFIAEYLEMKYV